MMVFVHYVSIYTDLLYISDDESDEDENESEAPEISELKTKHKKTGLPLIELKVNAAEMKIPPAKWPECWLVLSHCQK